jgi:hypothetical protein
VNLLHYVVSTPDFAAILVLLLLKHEEGLRGDAGKIKGVLGDRIVGHLTLTQANVFL